MIIVTGPTAVGKSELCEQLATNYDSKIVNCDSKQIYKEIPIITAQPLNKLNDLHRLYGYVSVHQNYSVNLWLQDFKKVSENSTKNGNRIIVTGGSGLYITTLVYGLSALPNISPTTRQFVKNLLTEMGKEKFFQFAIEKDPAILHCIHHNDSYRLTRALEVALETGESIFKWHTLIKKRLVDNQLKMFVLLPPQGEIYQKINDRFIEMFNNGAVDEVEKLLSMNLDPSLPAMRAHGVPEIIKYLRNEMTKDCAIESAQLNIRHYAKRQRTWFRNQFPFAAFCEHPEQMKTLISPLLESI